ncbi:MAG: serine--tRNA ligase, partial [Bacteroidota bacterium]
MLQLNVIRENTQEVKERLSKRNPAFAQVVDEVLVLDEKVRAVKAQLETNLAEANKLAKQIGELMKGGKKEEAESLKAQTATLKSEAKQLEETTKQLEDDLFQKLVTLPNTPHAFVPQGKSADDNEVVMQSGSLPQLMDGALPHWDI